MPRGFDNKDIASAAGRKSKRSVDSTAEQIRKQLTSKTINYNLIEKYFNELNALKGKSYVDSMNQLFKHILPQLKAIEFTPGEGLSVNITPMQFVKSKDAEDK